MVKSEWKRFGRGQVFSGEMRGFLYQSVVNPVLWKWKGITFEAETPLLAIEAVMYQGILLSNN